MLNPTRARVVLATPAPISHRTAEENLGIGYLAAVLRNNGYKVHIIDGWLEKLTPYDLALRIQAIEEPLWIGFSCYRSNMVKAIETLQHLRRSGIEAPIIAGGFGPTFFAEQFVQSGFDIVVRGEGEHTVLALTRHFCTSNPALEDIAGLTFRRGSEIVNTGPPRQENDLDQIPWPARDTLPTTLRHKSAVHILTSRGCAAHCLFCSIASFARLSSGPNWRQRNISSIVDELESLTQKGAKCFKIIDDSFIEPPRDAKWCSQLAEAIEQRSLRVSLRGSIRADRVTSQILTELRRAGFFSFSCGIESFSATALRRMAKAAVLEDNFRALDLFAENGILVQAGHILFDHDTTLVELRENLKGMRRYYWTISKGIFSEMFAAEGTPYTRALKKRGSIEREEAQLENHSYLVRDAKARLAYDALKLWHKSHMPLYDKAIDAISAPKAIDDSSIREFHRISIKLRERDLEVFALLLDLVEECDRGEVMHFIHEQIDCYRTWYDAIASAIDHAYVNAGLSYEASPNPFIS